MKIRDRVTRGVAAAGAPRTREKGAEAAGGQRLAGAADTIHISDRSLEIHRARSAALQAPDIREGMVDEVVGLLSRGEYHITGADVAPRMIREHMALATR